MAEDVPSGVDGGSGESVPNPEKNENAAALAALGASKGGRARAAALSPEQRSEIASAGATARWVMHREGGIALESVPVATHGGALRIAGIEMPCYVLEDGRRIISQRAVLNALGISRGATRDRLAVFAAQKKLKPFISNNLEEGISRPVYFRPPRGSVAYGYEATILTDLCDAILAARSQQKLSARQEHIANACEVLVRGFARVGIVALVDEATGYQAVRARDALAQILEKFIAKELRPWVRTFPPEYYEELFRLQNWQYPMDSENTSKRPPIVGKITDDVVYKRLAPGVRDELRRLIPRDEKGRLKKKLHQRLSPDIGSPKLKEHLSHVIVLMRASEDWAGFLRAINRALPRYDKNLELPLKS